MDTLLKLEAEERIKEILKKNLEELKNRIASACARAGRQPNSVRLVVATKTVDHHVIRMLSQLGVSEIGENKVQDAQRKHEALKDLPLRWHMFGHVQRNKVKKALQLFELIHSLDSLPLAQEIDRVSMSLGKRTAVLVEVNVSKEPQKYGLKEEDLPSFLERLSPMKGLQVLGLMCMTPVMEDPEPCRPFFHHLRELSEKINKQNIENIQMEHLSMGMTQDFEVAIEEGSNLIRVGTALFRGIC